MSNGNEAVAWQSPNPKETVILSSLWDGLSPHLLASFWAVERAGSGSRVWTRVEKSPIVKAPLLESSLEMTMGWQSPFENAGADKGVPAISSMLQSGAIQPWVSGNGKASEIFAKFEGRTGITKLNSTQVFAGMPPLKIQVTALFRAWRDPASEVEAPANQLALWALPQELAQEGPILSLLQGIKKAMEGKPIDEAAAKAMLPSVAPTKIAMKYKGRTYSPLVIESIGMPINAPVDKSGRIVEMQIPMTLCSLTAIDRADWTRSGNGAHVVPGFLS